MNCNPFAGNLPEHPETRHVDPLTASWTALKANEQILSAGHDAVSVTLTQATEGDRIE